MATRLPATRPATSTRHHGDVLVLPAKQTWSPKNWLFLLEIKVFPLSLVNKRLVVRGGSHFLAMVDVFGHVGEANSKNKKS